VAPVEGRPAKCLAGVAAETATILSHRRPKVLLRFEGETRIPEEPSSPKSIRRKTFG
jgi:hypothetical protein